MDGTRKTLSERVSQAIFHFENAVGRAATELVVGTNAYVSICPDGPRTLHGLKVTEDPSFEGERFELR